MLLLFAPLTLGEVFGDWFQFWFAGHLVVSGRSVYDQAAWFAAPAQYGLIAESVQSNCETASSAACLWIYPPWTALLFVPFGALPLDIGIPLLHVAVLALGCLALAAWARVLELRGYVLAFALVATGASEAFLLGSSSGHIDALLVLGALGVISALAGRAVGSAIGAVLLSLKPHLVFLLPAIVLPALVARRRLRPIVASVAALAVVAVIGFAIQPVSIEHFVGGTTKLGLNIATTYAFGALVFPGQAALAGALLAALGITLAVLAWRWCRPERRDVLLAAVGMCLSRALSPYAHTYDDMLDIPATMLAIALAPPRLRGVFWATIVVALVIYPWLAYFGGRLAETQAPSGAVALMVLAIVALAARADARAWAGGAR